MARTTLSLSDELFEKLTRLAKQSNRSASNMIETILLKYFEEDLFVDDFEMEEIHQDKNLKKSIKQGLKDYDSAKGRFL